jgi:competence protein ComEA
MLLFLKRFLMRLFLNFTIINWRYLMLKKLLLTMMLLASMSFAFASVDVNKADQAALSSIKGIGPTTSQAILDARKKDGNFKDWNDLQKRVKGIGEKRSEKLSKAGLTVNGMSKDKSGTASVAGKDSKHVAHAMQGAVKNK